MFLNLFIMEEPFQAYKAWKAGYTLYAPNKVVFYHLWEGGYRPIFEHDANKVFKPKAKEMKQFSFYA